VIAGVASGLSNVAHIGMKDLAFEPPAKEREACDDEGRVDLRLM
jgi:hypothetical protein